MESDFTSLRGSNAFLNCSDEYLQCLRSETQYHWSALLLCWWGFISGDTISLLHIIAIFNRGEGEILMVKTKLLCHWWNLVPNKTHVQHSENNHQPPAIPVSVPLVGTLDTVSDLPKLSRTPDQNNPFPSPWQGGKLKRISHPKLFWVEEIWPFIK